MEPQVDVSLVIACYNEEPVLVDNVREIMDVLDRTHYSYEIILVDDGSTDDTVALIEEFARQHPRVGYLLHPVNMGRGRTVADGIRRARGRVVGFIDIDLQTPARYLPSLIREIERGADVAIARRIYKLTPAVFGRWILSRGYMALSSLVLGLGRRDTETGCKVFRREAILPILEEVRDPHWFWDTEIMALAAYNGLDVVEVPTVFLREVSSRTSVKIFRDVFHYVVNLFRLRRRMGSALRAARSEDGPQAQYQRESEHSKRAFEPVGGGETGEGSG
ncbi:MAG: glycosyltransferase [Nitrospinae bacterium]|nr:glycosyltransferase [Nitrospinota bacterium]